MRGVGRRLVEIVEAGGGDLGVMIDRGKRAIAGGADAQPLAARRTMPDRPVHVLTAQHELDRPSDQPRRQNAENLWSGNQPFRAEAAGGLRAANMDLAGRSPYKPGSPPLPPS